MIARIDRTTNNDVTIVERDNGDYALLQVMGGMFGVTIGATHEASHFFMELNVAQEALRESLAKVESAIERMKDMG